MRGRADTDSLESVDNRCLVGRVVGLWETEKLLVEGADTLADLVWRLPEKRPAIVVFFAGGCLG